MEKKVLITLILAIILFSNIFTITAKSQGEPEINIVYPKENSEITEKQPEIKATFSDDGNINTDSVKIIFNDLDVTDWEEETQVTKTYVTHKVSEIFALKEGQYNVTVEVSDNKGNTAKKTWRFNVTKPVSVKGGLKIDVIGIVINIIIGTIIGSIILVAYIFYLKKTKNFTFRKFFAQHPLQKQYLTIYLPLIVSFIFILLGFAYIASNPDINTFSYEYVFVIGMFIAIGPFAISSQIEKRRIFKNERGFTQFLFEMADAMRGGLDPSKAVIELSKTNTGILREKLQIAADSIKIGRPFDEVITSMGRSFKSDLIKRYSSIIGEASKIGGETATVIFRASKDMDDFLKVQRDRKRELTMQVTTIYISFVVLIIIIYLLLTLFPSFEGIDISLISGGPGLSGAEATAAEDNSINRISTTTLTRRFFHVVVANAVGTGAVIGGFLDGRVKYGLLHILALVLGSTVFFALMLF